MHYIVTRKEGQHPYLTHGLGGIKEKAPWGRGWVSTNPNPKP